MKESTTKEKILKSLRNALLTKTTESESLGSFPVSVFRMEENDLSIAFAESLSETGGIFYYCVDEETIRNQLRDIISQSNTNELVCYNQGFLNFVKSLGIENISLAVSNKKYPFGIMLCENFIAQDGSITFSERQGFHNQLAPFPDTFIVFGFTSQVVDTYKTSLNQLKLRYAENPPKSTITLRINKNNSDNISKLIVILVEDQQYE